MNTLGNGRSYLAESALLTLILDELSSDSETSGEQIDKFFKLVEKIIDDGIDQGFLCVSNVDTTNVILTPKFATDESNYKERLEALYDAFYKYNLLIELEEKCMGTEKGRIFLKIIDELQEYILREFPLSNESLEEIFENTLKYIDEIHDSEDVYNN